MHFKCDCLILLPLIIFPPTIGQRRIIDGRTTNVNASFVVYLLDGDPESTKDPGWLCGGSIVDRWYVLTSAACLEDVQFIYVVAGYEKYVGAEHMDEDRCISRTRKRIISWCYLSNYTIGDNGDVNDWEKSRIWASTDIALARVNEPFDFYDPIYEKYCSYLPSIITVGTSNLHEMPGLPVLAYGWGHRKYLSVPGDKNDYNSERLYYASTRIIDKANCTAKFSLQFIKDNIDRHGVCTSGPGFLDDEGRTTHLIDKPNMNCGNDTGCTYFPEETRRQGICQNDHGGPLVAWAGGRLYVVGVASFYRVNEEWMCTSPYVFMATRCVSKFLLCILSRTRRSDVCAQENNIEIVEKQLDWSEFDRRTTVTEKADPSTFRTAVTDRENPPNFRTNVEEKENPPPVRTIVYGKDKLIED